MKSSQLKFRHYLFLNASSKGPYNLNDKSSNSSFPKKKSPSFIFPKHIWITLLSLSPLVKVLFPFHLSEKAFLDRWNGNKSFTKGERDNSVIQMCFGNKKEGDFFFGNDEFDDLSSRLYGPLVEALKNNV